MYFFNSYEFLSNFYECRVPILLADGQFISAKSAEHAFQALKTVRVSEQLLVLAQATAGKAKRMGRRVTLREGWDSGVNVHTMMYVVSQKFAYNPDLMELLLKVDEPLIEDNHWHDNYWGHCTCVNCVNVQSRNWLGTILRNIRLLELERRS